jgi:ATP-dependent DNA helicase RecG
MVFVDRVEIISPGHLPDSLSTDSIRHGATNRRNPTLTEHAVHILPYRGLGTGITRALQDWPNIEFVDGVAANQFRVVMRRPTSGGITPQVTPQLTPQVTGEVQRLLAAMRGEMKRAEIQAALGLNDRKHFRDAYLHPAQIDGFIEMNIPDAPNSKQQRYRLTLTGSARLAELKSG